RRWSHKDGYSCNMSAIFPVNTSESVRDRALMNGRELSAILGILPSQIPLPAHVKCTLFLTAAPFVTLGIVDTVRNVPATLISTEDHRSAVMACSDQVVLGSPDQAKEGKTASNYAEDGAGGLLGASWIHQSESGIMTGICETISAGRKCDS